MITKVNSGVSLITNKGLFKIRNQLLPLPVLLLFLTVFFDLITLSPIGSSFLQNEEIIALNLISLTIITLLPIQMKPKNIARDGEIKSCIHKGWKEIK